MENRRYRYFALERPIMPGTCPDDFVGFGNFDEKTYVEEAGRKVWGQVYYERELSQKELNTYEMAAEKYSNVPMEQRLSEDELDYAKEVLALLDEKGAEHDQYGNIKLYHRTDEKSANIIHKSRKMLAKENGVFFSTKRDGQAAGYGDSIVEFLIPVEELEVDDVFADEVHFRYPLVGKNRILDVSRFIKD